MITSDEKRREVAAKLRRALRDKARAGDGARTLTR